MPQHKSAAKRVRQNARRRLQNRQHKVRARTMAKELAETTDPAAAEAKLRELKAHLDRMAGRRIVHPNAAAREKGRLERYVRSLSA